MQPYVVNPYTVCFIDDQTQNDWTYLHNFFNSHWRKSRIISFLRRHNLSKIFLKIFEIFFFISRNSLRRASCLVACSGEWKILNWRASWGQINIIAWAEEGRKEKVTPTQFWVNVYNLWSYKDRITLLLVNRWVNHVIYGSKYGSKF